MTNGSLLHAYHGLKVVVTGGAGFIGSELSAQLHHAGARVTILDNLRNGKRSNVADIVAGGATLLVEDIRDQSAVSSALKGADVVFHLACLGVRHSLHSPVENHDVNATATLSILAAARARNVSRFVHVSTSEVYGHARTAPMTEDHPTVPTTVYGASKLAGERYAGAFHSTYGYPTTIVRPFNAYGPRSHHEGDSGEVIPKFMLRCLAGMPLHVHGDGDQSRDFTFVSDTATGIALAGLSEAAIGQTINLGHGKEITVNELARTVSAVIGVTPRVVHGPARPGDVRRLIADTTVARGLLGYAPVVALHDGLALLRDWYRAQPIAAEEALRAEQVANWQPPEADVAILAVAD